LGGQPIELASSEPTQPTVEQVPSIIVQIR
jgi:hypothetical protein